MAMARLGAEHPALAFGSLALAAGAGTAAMAGAAGAGMVTFYRGVSALEATQIAKDGVMKAVAWGVEDAKYLTNTIQSAQEWGARMHGEGSRVAEVVVTKAAAKTFEYMGRWDAIGEAWFARMSSLKDAAARILPK